MTQADIEAEVAAAMAALDDTEERLQVGLILPNGAGAIVQVYDVPLTVLGELTEKLDPYRSQTIYQGKPRT